MRSISRSCADSSRSTSSSRSSSSARLRSVMSTQTPCQKRGRPSSSRIRTERSFTHTVRPSRATIRYSRSYGPCVRSASSAASRTRSRSSGWMSDGHRGSSRVSSCGGVAEQRLDLRAEVQRCVRALGAGRVDVRDDRRLLDERAVAGLGLPELFLCGHPLGDVESSRPARTRVRRPRSRTTIASSRYQTTRPSFVTIRYSAEKGSQRAVAPQRSARGPIRDRPGGRVRANARSAEPLLGLEAEVAHLRAHVGHASRLRPSRTPCRRSPGCSRRGPGSEPRRRRRARRPGAARVVSNITPCQKSGAPASSRTSTASSWIHTTRPSLANIRYSATKRLAGALDTAVLLAQRRGRRRGGDGGSTRVGIDQPLVRPEPEDPLDLRAHVEQVAGLRALLDALEVHHAGQLLDEVAVPLLEVGASLLRELLLRDVHHQAADDRRMAAHVGHRVADVAEPHHRAVPMHEPVLEVVRASPR